jgi:hypothetical protein
MSRKTLTQIASQEDIHRIRYENEKMKKKVKRLERRIDKLKREKKNLEEEFKEYKARHPETVGVKHGKPYAIKSNTKSSTQKRRGAVKGHKGTYRPIPDDIDSHVSLKVDQCPHCDGTNLSASVQEIRTRVVEDIPPIKPQITKYYIERRYCRNCKKIVESTLTHAFAKCRIGIRAMLTIVYFKNGQRIPINGIRKIMKDVFNFQLSEGEICLILKIIANAFGPYYYQMIEDLKAAPARYIDETSWRIDGNNSWLWAFITKYESVFYIAEKRDHKVPLGILGTEYCGVDIHDRFSAYDTLAKKTKKEQQVCWAHIINDAKELAQYYGTEGEFILDELKKTHNNALEFDHKGTDDDIQRLFDNLSETLIRPYKSSHCYKFVNNLLKRENSLFVFVKNPYVESTNNRAERGIRHSVIARKISGGSKSNDGAKTYGILTSVLLTMRQRGENFITQGMKIALTSHG